MLNSPALDSRGSLQCDCEYGHSGKKQPIAGWILIQAGFDAFVELMGPKPLSGITFILPYIFTNTREHLHAE